MSSVNASNVDYENSTTVRNLYRLWAACPCLSWSEVAKRALTWVVFAPGFFHADVALWQQAGHETIRGRSVFVKYLNALI